MADDDKVTIRLPKTVAKKAAKAVVAEVMDGGGSKALQRHLHDGTAAGDVGLLKAEVAYLTDPQLRPVEFFYPLASSAMPFAVYIKRAADDRWEAEREKIRAAAKSELVRRVGSQIVREQVKEAEEVNKLRGWLLKLLTPEEDADGHLIFQVAPKSLEGCVKVFKEVSILLQMYRQTVLQQIEPHAPSVVDEDKVTRGPFTDEEAGQIAEQLMRKRFSISGGEK